MNSFSLQMIFDESYDLYSTGQYNSSLSLIKESADFWFKSPPYRVKFIILMGINNYKINDYLTAIRVLSEALYYVPNNQKILSLLGKINLKLNNYPEAIRVYSKARRLNRSKFDFTLKLAFSLYKNGDYKVMFDMLKRGYNPKFIKERDRTKLRDLLSDFLRDSSCENKFKMVKKFREYASLKDSSFSKIKLN